MRIIHIFPYTVRCPGGHSNAVREFIACQRAAGLDSSGLSPTSNEEFQDTRDPGPHCLEVPFENPAQVFAEVQQRCGSGRGIVHLHAITPLTTALARMARSDGMKVVITSHGQLNTSGLLHFAKKAGYLALFPSPVRHAHGIHVLTRRERDRLRFMIPWFRGQVAVIPHVVTIPVLPADFERHPGGSGRERIILHLGRLDVRTKGLDLLLTAFARANLSNARLVLAGPDWNDGKRDLEALATRLGCRDRVEFPGAIYGEDKDRLIASADLFVATSRWDAFNLSLVEALARGLPALVSDRLNLAPELETAEAATVVKCHADQIAAGLDAMLENPAKLARTGLTGRRWVEANTSPATVGAAFVAFYNSLP